MPSLANTLLTWDSTVLREMNSWLQIESLEYPCATLVGVRGRHLDVDERGVRLGPGDDLEQFVRVAGASYDVESRIGEQPGQALPEQCHVLGDNDTHGNSAVIVVRAAVVS